MAENIDINFKTRADTGGADKAARSITAIETELKQLRADLNAAAVGSKEFEALSRSVNRAETELREAKAQARQFAAEVDQLATASQRAAVSNLNLARTSNTSASGFKGLGPQISNVSFQLQDFAVQVAGGTLASRAFTQQAPQLLSVLGPKGAIAGAAIAVAPLVVQLFKGGEDAAKKAMQEAKEYAETLDQYREIHEGFSLGDGIKEDSVRRAEDLSRLQEQQTLLNRLATDEAGLEKRRIAAEGQIAIARKRYELSLIEAELVTATGEKAVRLAKEREGVIQAILEAERQVAEQQRQQEQQAALAKLRNAQDVAIKTQGDANRFEIGREQAQLKVNETEKLRQEIEAREELRKALLAEKEQKLRELETALASPESNFTHEEVSAMRERISEITKQLETAVGPFGQSLVDYHADLTARLETEKKDLTEATTAWKDSKQALEAVSNQLANAGFDLANLLANQNVDRTQENQTRSFEEAKRRADEGGTAAVQALDAFLDAAPDNAKTSEAVAALRAIIEDGVLSAEELKKLPNLLQQYEAKIRGTGDKSVTIMQTAIDKIDAYERRLADLETTVKALPN